MSGGTRPWSDFRAALEAAGVRPSRRLGQNFLTDSNLVRAIARDAELRPGEFVLEVGPGGGFLTQHLLAAGARVLAVEIDSRLAEVTREMTRDVALDAEQDETAAPAESDRLDVLHTDVLASKNALAQEVLARLPRDEPWQLVANLPYSVASPLLVLLARRPHPPRAMTGLVQREVADRILAGPGTPHRGPLGVRLAATYRARLVRTVAPRLFWPPPQVDSAVIRLELRPDRPGPEVLAAFDELVGGLFQHRRQTLERRLREWTRRPELVRSVLERLNLDPRARPELLATEQFFELAAALIPASPASPDGARTC